MKNIIAYSLFGTEERYWASIPFNLIANDLIYNGFISRFYVSKEIPNNRLFPILLEAQKTGKVEVVVIDDDYIATEPTIWRMRPLWDVDVDLLYCRDMDAAPRSDERRATRLFESSDFVIHGIRSFWTHSTKLMAGLCGFKVPQVKRAIPQFRSFDSYKEYGKRFVRTACTNWEWGCDQHLLRTFFFAGRNGLHFRHHTLDTPLGTAGALSGVQLPTAPKEQYEAVSLSDINQEILDICDKLVPYVGLPITVENSYLRQALKIECEMSKSLDDIFSSNSTLAEHYQVCGNN